MKFKIYFLFCFLIFSGNPFLASDIALLFSLPPFANPASLKQHFIPLAQHLSKVVNTPVKVSIAPHYISHVMRLDEGKTDIVFFDPSSYINPKDKFGGIELLA